MTSNQSRECFGHPPRGNHERISDDDFQIIQGEKSESLSHQKTSMSRRDRDEDDRTVLHPPTAGAGQENAFMLLDALATMILVAATIAILIMKSQSGIQQNSVPPYYRNSIKPSQSIPFLKRSYRRYLQNDTSTDAVIMVEVAPGQNADNVSDVLAALDNSTASPTLAPLITSFPSSTTNSPTNNESLTTSPGSFLPETMTPTSSPSISSQPSQRPTISPFPSESPRPTRSISPSNQPSSPPTDFPSGKPTITSVPTNHPSAFPTISAAPTDVPSEEPTFSPTNSSMPSYSPSISWQPTSSPQPTTPSPSMSLMPTTQVLPSRNISETGIIMTLVDVPEKVDTIIWENITSNHVFDFYRIVSNTYPHDVDVHIVEVNTILREQDVIGESGSTGDSNSVLFGNDLIDNNNQEPPPPSPVNGPSAEVTSTQMQEPSVRKTLRIVYDQWITYKPTEQNTTNQELYDQFFVLPFTSNSFNYSINLVDAMNWTNWVTVETIYPGEREVDEEETTQVETFRLTQAQTIIISISIVASACLIVLFLLWDRKHKGGGGHDGSIFLGDDHSAIGNFGEQYPMGWNEGRNGPNKGNQGEEETISSIRSAPAHLRRGDRYGNSNKRFLQEQYDEEQTRDRMQSTDETIVSREGQNYGHTRDQSMVSRSESITNSSSGREDSSINKNVPKTNNQRHFRRSFLSHLKPSEDFSPAIPRQVPIASAGRSISSTSDRSSSNREGSVYPPIPALPPLPPPSSFSQNNGNDASIATTINSNDSYGGPNIPPQLFQQRSSVGYRSSRRPYNMRVSDISDDGDFYFTSGLQQDGSEQGGMGSDEFLKPIPDQHLHHYGANQRHPDYSPPESASPLHIPDEEAAIDPHRSASPENPISTMLGLSPLPEQNLISPSQSGFEMKVQDLDE